MTYEEMERAVISLAEYIDSQIDSIAELSDVLQKRIYDMLSEEILKFEISEGAFVIGQDFRKRLLIIQNKIESVFSSRVYKQSIKEFLTNFDTIQQRTIDLNKSLSDLELDIKELSPAKQIIYEQASASFSPEAIAAEYIEPVKKLVANNVLQGQSIKKTVTLLENWNEGNLSSGRLAEGTPTPNLQRYATQIARDTAYSVNRTTNNIIKEQYGLKRFIYAGNLVKDSRPICVHLVGLNRPIEFTELPPLLNNPAYQKGLYPNTTHLNFCNTAGGFSCRHIVMPIA